MPTSFIRTQWLYSTPAYSFVMLAKSQRVSRLRGLLRTTSLKGSTRRCPSSRFVRHSGVFRTRGDGPGRPFDHPLLAENVRDLAWCVLLESGLNVRHSRKTKNGECRLELFRNDEKLGHHVHGVRVGGIPSGNSTNYQGWIILHGP